MDIEQMIVESMDSHEDRLVGLLRSLVQFPTENPPGNEEPAQRWVAERLRELNAEVDIFDVLPGRPDVVGLLRGIGDGRSIILNSHVDVVEARQRESWQHDPFEAVVEGRIMYGRGTSDMKSAMAAYLFVLEQLRKNGVRLKGDIIFQSVIGEEAAEPGTKYAAERYRADFAIIGEPTQARQIVGSVGVMTARVLIKSPYTLHLHARRLMLHAGGGLEGANAVEKMALRIIPALNDLEREWAVFKKHPHIPYGQTLINPFLIQGGSSAFLMPDTCTMYIVVLYLPTEQPARVQQQVEDQIRRAAEVDSWLRLYPPEVEWDPPECPVKFPPADLDVNHPGIQELNQAIQDVRSGAGQIGGRGAITDAGWLQLRGTPTVVYGPGDIHWAHRVDERVNLDDVLDYAKVIGIFLLRWCGISL